MSISRGRKSRPFYGVGGWPRSRGFLCTILRAMQSGTKVSVRYSRSGRLSGVVVKRGSTVLYITISVVMKLKAYFSNKPLEGVAKLSSVYYVYIIYYPIML